MERTEEEKLVQAPLKVILAGKEREIKPLVIRESRKWRKKVANLFRKLPGYIKANTDDLEGFEASLQALLLDMPDEIADLFFAYAKDLDRAEIENSATDAELGKAFQEVMAFAFPLSQSLTKGLGASRQQEKPSSSSSPSGGSPPTTS
jgi:hypothetical protein